MQTFKVPEDIPLKITCKLLIAIDGEIFCWKIINSKKVLKILF
jgi:hypothetical protein